MALLPFDILSCIMDFAENRDLLGWSLVNSSSSRLARVLLAIRRTVEVKDTFPSLSSFLMKLNDREGSALDSSSTALPPFSSLLRSLTLNLPFPSLTHLPLHPQDSSPIQIQNLTLILPSANFRLSSFHAPLLSLFSPRVVTFVPPQGGEWIFHFRVHSKVQRLLKSWKDVKEWRFKDCNPIFDEEGFFDDASSGPSRSKEASQEGECIVIADPA
ncbi:hypothetical protein BDY24DRAFT_437823 [Mrakia frigida]|uniref:uncharacterized protein n=1 Tax=Mrakia frigida TaxID=29902 RepID=UPI003FCC0B20